MFKVYSTGYRKVAFRQNPFLDIIKFGNVVRKSSTLGTPTTKQTSRYWLAGLVDAEGCFRISILKNSSYREGSNLPQYKIRLYFQISLHIKDIKVLEDMITELGVGRIYKTKSRPDIAEIQVSSIKDLKAILEFFEQYPLITQKYADYELFKQAYLIISSKQHLTSQGILKLVALKASSNWGLSKDLIKAFPKITPVTRVQPNQRIPNGDWLLGFVSGEGSFMLRIIESTTHKLGYQVGLRFQITQHCKDKLLMENLVEYFQCGYLSCRGDIVDFKVTNFSDIQKTIIPFFDENPLLATRPFSSYHAK
uniref:LAGLIDADG endonuclease n=1 Tax=Juglanconis juglandina TaxID=1940567 RepID=A0A291LJD7_9PEZI|nr:LAGLIDADG endonuclease [Juglanconis juglandina]